MTALETAYQWVFSAALIVLGALLFFALVRCVKGPTIADRIVAVNMSGTVTICMIAVLAVMMNEGYLVDVELIYAMLSFLAVVLLTKVYMGAVREKQVAKEKEAGKDA
ncbi:MAG: monovalent cation/H+ antiporter complex subunit F [Eubacteriales bacterium]|nr:monovalent cation/H+ antiporter complex subunit F [Eubacteriales bacterium]